MSQFNSINPIIGNINQSEHDGHSSHWDGVSPASHCSTHVERAIRLYREPVVCPSNVRIVPPVAIQASMKAIPILVPESLGTVVSVYTEAEMVKMEGRY